MPIDREVLFGPPSQTPRQLWLPLRRPPRLRKARRCTSNSVSTSMPWRSGSCVRRCPPPSPTGFCRHSARFWLPTSTRCRWSYFQQKLHTRWRFRRYSRIWQDNGRKAYRTFPRFQSLRCSGGLRRSKPTVPARRPAVRRSCQQVSGARSLALVLCCKSTALK